MSNFIVPAVGNPNGGFQDGDQVTAANLNAHVMDAIPTGEFISGRTESTTLNLTDYFLKVESDGNLYRIASSLVGANAETADHETIKVSIIQPHNNGNGGSTPFNSITVNNTSNIAFNLGAYSDPLDNNGGQFSVTGNTYAFDYRHAVGAGSANLFVIGDTSRKSTFVLWGDTVRINSSVRPVNFNSNNAIRIPSGTTAERPTTPDTECGDTGLIRYNTTTSKIEVSTPGVVNGWSDVYYPQTAVKTGNVGTLGAGIVYRSTSEFDIPDNETWLLSIDAHWSTPASGNTQPGYWYETAIFATKNTYTDVELKRYYTSYTPYSGINRFNVTIPLTKALLGNLSKKIEIRTYATNNSTTLATFSNLNGPSSTNWYSVSLVKVKTADFTANNAIL